MSRLCNTERKLEKDKFIQGEYRKTIESYIEKGYLKRVTEEESPPAEVWYLPHFLVVRMDKTSTKVRIVFDCSAKTDGISLNDVIYAGSKLQQELFDVLIRFRRNPVALVLVSYAACSRVRGFLPTYRLLTAATHSIPIVST